MPAGGIAAACLTVLSLWRWQDGEVGWALVLLLLAFVQLALVARRRSRRPMSGTTPTGAEIDVARRHHTGWRAIGLFGIVGGVGTVVVFPPLSLVLAGLGVYATFRARRDGRLLASAS